MENYDSRDLGDHRKPSLPHKQYNPNQNHLEIKFDFENDGNSTFSQSVKNSNFKTQNNAKQYLSLLNFGNEMTETNHQPLSLQEELQLLNEKLEQNERSKNACCFEGNLLLIFT